MIIYINCSDKQFSPVKKNSSVKMFQFEKVRQKNRKRNRRRCLFRSRFRFKGYLHVSLSCLVYPVKPGEKIQQFHVSFRQSSGHLRNQLQKKRTRLLSFKESMKE